jgi:hypothetical protein
MWLQRYSWIGTSNLLVCLRGIYVNVFNSLFLIVNRGSVCVCVDLSIERRQKTQMLISRKT